MSCCEPFGGGWDATVGECSACGAPIDKDGDAVDVCGHSQVDCEVCGSAPCDGGC